MADEGLSSRINGRGECEGPGSIRSGTGEGGMLVKVRVEEVFHGGQAQKWKMTPCVWRLWMLLLRQWVSSEKVEVLERKVEAKVSLLRGQPRRSVPVVSSVLGLPFKENRLRADWRA